MKKFFFQISNPTNKHLNMKNKKSLIKKLIFTLAFLGTISFSQNKVNADESPVCPDTSSTTITSIADGGDATSFYALTSGGFCRGTPETYGVTVYKMGFCTKNPGNPTTSSVLPVQIMITILPILVLGLMIIHQERQRIFPQEEPLICLIHMPQNLQ